MRTFASVAATLSWFTGGILLGLIEVISLPGDPAYSTILQLLPLLFLLGGVGFVALRYEKLGTQDDSWSRRLRLVMILGWFAIYGVNAGLASVNNIATLIFHMPLPYYYQGVSLAQKTVALAGIFILGGATILAWKRSVNNPSGLVARSVDFWEKPMTNIGFMALLLGIVLGLARYWSTIVFAGFVLLLAGVMLYPVGKLTEKDIELPD